MKKNIIKNKNHKKILIALLCNVFIFSALAIFLLKVSIGNIVLFLMFQILCIALPGIAAARLLKIDLTALEKLVASYGMGIILNLLIYFSLAPFHLVNMIPIAMGILVVLSILVLFLFRVKKAERFHTRGELTVALIFSSVMCLLTFLLLSLANLSPDISGARLYYHDLTNGIALITSASFGFPMEFLQMSGTLHFYHPFFYAYCAVMKLCTGLSSFDIGTKYSLITIAPFFASAFIALARRIFIKTSHLIISAISVMLFFFPMIYYVAIDLLGFSLSLSFACCSVLFFLKAEKMNSKMFNKLHIVSIIFMIGCLGAKGSNGVTLVFSVCFSLLLSLVRNKRWLRVASTGLLYSLSFFISYFALYQRGAEGMSLRKDNLLHQRMAYFLLMPEKWPSWLKVFLSNMIFTVNFNRALIICFLVLFATALLVKRRLNPIVDVAIGGLLCGITLSNLFLQNGSSEVYFLYTAIPFAVISAVYCLSRIYSFANKRWRYILAGIFITIFAPILTIEAVGTIKSTIPYFDDSVKYSPLSSSRVFSKDQLFAKEVSRRPLVITPMEYEGLIWLRENTDKNAVIAEGCYLLSDRYFYGSTFGERRFYLEGCIYVTMVDSNKNTPEKIRRDSVLSLFYGVEDESFVPLLRSYGIDYIVIFQCQNEGWYFTNEYGSKTVFMNDDIAIYDIR